MNIDIYYHFIKNKKSVIKKHLIKLTKIKSFKKHLIKLIKINFLIFSDGSANKTNDIGIDLDLYEYDETSVNSAETTTNLNEMLSVPITTISVCFVLILVGFLIYAVKKYSEFREECYRRIPLILHGNVI